MQSFRSLFLKKIIEPRNLNNFRKFSSKSRCLKATVCGAAGSVGNPLCMMLKQAPLFEELAVYDIKDTKGLAADLNHMDTRCRVEAYSGAEQIADALTNAKVVLVTSAASREQHTTREDMFCANAEIVRNIAEACLQYCPTALVGIVTDPVNSLVPVACEVFRKNGINTGSNILGVTTLDILRANTFLAQLARFEPETVIVPVIGGHSSCTTVPLFSLSNPSVQLTKEQAQNLTLAVQNAAWEIEKAKDGKESATLAAALATARFSCALGKAVLGEANVVECAYVRSTVRKEIDYLSTPVILGTKGVKENLGLPTMSDYEKCLLETAIPHLQEDIRKGVNFVRGEDEEEEEEEETVVPAAEKATVTVPSNSYRCEEQKYDIQNVKTV